MTENWNYSFIYKSCALTLISRIIRLVFSLRSLRIFTTSSLSLVALTRRSSLQDNTKAGVYQYLQLSLPLSEQLWYVNLQWKVNQMIHLLTLTEEKTNTIKEEAVFLRCLRCQDGTVHYTTSVLKWVISLCEVAWRFRIRHRRNYENLSYYFFWHIFPIFVMTDELSRMMRILIKTLSENLIG